jgi:hypothetical protein
METLNTILKCKSFGTFKNDKDEYCRISTWYEKHTKKIQVIFCKEGEVANRFAITSTSEKRIIKLIKEEKFELCEN